MISNRACGILYSILHYVIARDLQQVSHGFLRSFMFLSPTDKTELRDINEEIVVVTVQMKTRI